MRHHLKTLLQLIGFIHAWCSIIQLQYNIINLPFLLLHNNSSPLFHSDYNREAIPIISICQMCSHLPDTAYHWQATDHQVQTQNPQRSLGSLTDLRSLCPHRSAAYGNPSLQHQGKTVYPIHWTGNWLHRASCRLSSTESSVALLSTYYPERKKMKLDCFMTPWG